MAFTMERRTQAAFLWIAGFTVLLGALAYWSTTRYVTAVEWVTHSQVVKAELDDLLIGLVTAETSLRGYFLTNDPEFLEPFQRSRSDVEQHLRQLGSLTQDNPRQGKNLSDLQALVHARLERLDIRARVFQATRKRIPYFGQPARRSVDGVLASHDCAHG